MLIDKFSFRSCLDHLLVLPAARLKASVNRSSRICHDASVMMFICVNKPTEFDDVDKFASRSHVFPPAPDPWCRRHWIMIKGSLAITGECAACRSGHWLRLNVLMPIFV